MGFPHDAPERVRAGLIYLLTLPLAALALKSATKEALSSPGQHKPNQLTILLHAVGSLALTIGLVISAVTG